ncbi:MAG TPA: hypothetical protein VMU90_01165 [Solirubrobacteraceae bacterium]|nr:hypothetical protein [Solirubrobacteraceae bacterium]
MSEVRQIPAPPEARALSTLDHVDYADAFLVDPNHPDERTPEQWLRLMMDGAPLHVRSTLLSGWSALGLKLGSGGILGWRVRQSEADHVLVRAESRIGMPAELLLKRHEAGLLFCTFVQHDNVAARGVWAGVEPVHVPIVRRVLAQGMERAEAAVAGSGAPPRS